MRNIIIIIVTFIILMFILFYYPYLGVYENKITFEYDLKEENYFWKYEIDNDILKLNESSENKFTFLPKKSGKCNVTFEYVNKTNNESKYKIHYKFKVKNNKIYWLEGIGYGLLSFPNPY